MNFNIFKPKVSPVAGKTDTISGVNGSNGSSALTKQQFAADKLYTIKVEADPLKSNCMKAIFDYLNSDFETMGFHDALTMPDLKYRNDRLASLQLRYLMLLKECGLTYSGFLLASSASIKELAKNGLDDYVTRAEAKRQSVQAALAFTVAQETEVMQRVSSLSGTLGAMTPVSFTGLAGSGTAAPDTPSTASDSAYSTLVNLSAKISYEYTCGFARGIAALALTNFIDKDI